MKIAERSHNICFVGLLLFLFLFTGDAFAKEGEGGEENWIERKFHHYEYVPYVNGSEIPRMVYRSISVIGEQSLVFLLGRTRISIDRFPGAKIEGKKHSRDEVFYSDSRSVNRTDVYIFCDFEVEYRRQYVIENYPYRDFHFHYVYYETPVSIVGFGMEAGPTSGARELNRLYLTRDMLKNIVGDFEPSLLVPHAAVHTNDPKGTRTKFREWKTGPEEYHISYVFELEKEKEEFGFWSFFDMATLEAVAGANSAEKYFRNKKVLDDARRGLNDLWRHEENASPKPRPDWIDAALAEKIAISPETVEGYHMKPAERKFSRAMYAFDAANLDAYFPSINEVLKLYSDESKKLAEDFYSKSRAVLPPWNLLSYDYGRTSGPGSWLVWNRDGDAFSFQIHSENANVLAHWLFGDAQRTLYANMQSEKESLLGTGDDEKDWTSILKETSGRSDVDLGNMMSIRAVYNGIAKNNSFLVDKINSALIGDSVEYCWSETWLTDNPSSPWQIFTDTKLYNAIVPWTSLSAAFTFIDAPGTAWTRGIQFTARPTVVFAAQSEEPVSAVVSDMKEITGIPDSFSDAPAGASDAPRSDGSSFTPETVKKMADEWNITIALDATSKDGKTLIRYGTVNYFPVDLVHAQKIKNALENAYESKIDAIENDKLIETLNRLFDRPASAGEPGSFGLSHWNKNAENMFTGKSNSYSIISKQPYVRFNNYGKDSFGWNLKLDIWKPVK